MTIVLLIRHGQTEYVAAGRAAGRTPGIPLDKAGREQAAALAQRIKHLPLKGIYSSPIQRASETAQAVADVFGLPVQIRDGLMETDTGEWTGLYFKDLQDLPTWRALQSHPKGTRLPGGETVDEIQMRMAAEIDAICRAHPDDIVAVVSHADPIKAAVAHYIGLDVDYFQRLVINPTSVTVLAIGDHRPMLIVMNHGGDLPDMTPKAAPRQLVRRISWPEEGQKMPRMVYDLKSISRITASAEGLPGHRTFYIQARDNDKLFTLLCEKEQVRALAEGVDQLLEELEQKQASSEETAEIPDAELELEQPLEPVFRVGQLGLGYDEDAKAVVLIAYEMPENEETDPETLAVARFWVSRSQIRALSRHGAAVVVAGRPACPLCGEPMDPEGHICPKKNGHKKIEIE